MSKHLAVLLTLSLLLVSPAAAKPKSKEVCLYATKSGEIRQASSLDDVPRESRATAKCAPLESSSYLAKPDEISLSGNQRTESISSSVGTIHLRWPRKVESLFGRTPLRAMTDAAGTVSRAVKNAAFPSRVQTLNLEWNVVFMDESLPEGQIPAQLVSNCHPGWMTPPANIYIVAQRVAGGCGSSRSSASVADSQLAEVLVHEMGHAVEFYLLAPRGRPDRMRSEGFATWFERYAAKYSAILNESDLERRAHEAAAYSFRQNPASFSFQGSFEDYARASFYFTALTSPRGLPGLMDVYEAMASSGLPFPEAIAKALNWDERRLNKEIEQLLRR